MAVVGKKLFLAFATEHVPHAKQHAEDGATVIALDFWVEESLRALGIPFRSITEFASLSDAEALLHEAQRLARAWYQVPELASFTHRSVPLGAALEPMLDFYFERVLYQLATLTPLLAACSNVEELVVPRLPLVHAPTAGPLAAFEVRVVGDVAELLAHSHNLRFTEVVVEHASAPSARTSLVQRLFFTLFNTGMSRLPRRSCRVLASEYWSHIGGAVGPMSEVEIVMLDRREMRTIPFYEILRHRIRFMHPADLLFSRSERIATIREEEWRHLSEAARSSISTLGFTYAEHSWYPIADTVFAYLIESYASRLVDDIERLNYILVREKIQKVLVRASIGGREPLLYLLCRVARGLNIPTIEVQHALEVADKSSVHSQLAADYLASYGPHTRAVMVENHGYDPSRIRDIGSPRFDSYVQRSRSKGEVGEGRQTLGLTPGGLTVLVAMPPEFMDFYPAHFTSYEVRDMFEALVVAQAKYPELQFILKFRPGSITNIHRAYLQEIFPHGRYIVTDGDLFSLLLLSDVACAGNSTVLIESLVAGLPTLLFPIRRHDRAFIERYQGIAPPCHTREHLITELEKLRDPAERTRRSIQAVTFIGESYVFDGHAGERLQDLLREPLVAVIEPT